MPVPGHAQPLDENHCRLCWLWHNDASYRKRWDPDFVVQQATPVATKPPTEDCIHLGSALPNQTCRCPEKLRRCDIHKECTTMILRENVACCRTCPDREVDSIGD